MKNNFISILITNYNKEKFLKKCLNSIKNQNYKNYEVILFDDCSTDNSLNIIKNFKKIKLLKNKKRNNRSAPLNQINGIFKAFKKSKGNLICLLDSDDYFKKNKLRIVDKKFKNKNISSLYDFPETINNLFKYKEKSNDHIWPSIFPTSCMSITREKFKIFEKHVERSKYLNLEIDARLTIFLKFYFNEYNVLEKNLTVYNYDENSITAKIPKYSVKWWLRRFEAYRYYQYILRKKKKNFEFSADYFVTIFFIFLIRTLKL